MITKSSQAHPLQAFWHGTRTSIATTAAMSGVTSFHLPVVIVTKPTFIFGGFLAIMQCSSKWGLITADGILTGNMEKRRQPPNSAGATGARHTGGLKKDTQRNWRKPRWQRGLLERTGAMVSLPPLGKPQCSLEKKEQEEVEGKKWGT